MFLEPKPNSVPMLLLKKEKKNKTFLCLLHFVPLYFCVILFSIVFFPNT